MYSRVSAGRGTLMVESTKPVGTGAVCVNCWSEPTESIRNKFVPLSWHAWSALSEQRSSFNTGTHEGGQRLPVSFSPVGLHRAKLQLPERGWPERFVRIDHREKGFGIAQHQSSVRHAEQHTERFVGVPGGG